MEVFLEITFEGNWHPFYEKLPLWAYGAASCQYDELQRKKSDMSCSNNTDCVEPVSVGEVRVCLEERCGTTFFLKAVDGCLGITFFGGKREEN